MFIRNMFVYILGENIIWLINFQNIKKKEYLNCNKDGAIQN